MKKSMCEIKVETTNDGNILIVGPYDLSEGTNYSIEISPDQVDALIKWLREAKKELKES